MAVDVRNEVKATTGEDQAPEYVSKLNVTGLCLVPAGAAATQPEPEPEPEQLLASAPPEGVPPASTSEAAFGALLQQLGVAAYAGALAEESIRSADDLRELTADDLKELGFKMGDRKRVLKWSAAQ